MNQRAFNSKNTSIPGLHIIGDLHACACGPQLLCDRDSLQQLCCDLVVEAGLSIVGQCFHRFGEAGGVTGVVVLAESHLSLHTWPEADYVTLDVYVCNYSGDNRAKAEWLFASLSRLFAAQTCNLHRVERG